MSEDGGSAPGRIEDLAARLRHRFRDPALLEQALTHSSAGGQRGAGSNERLEFLGDRVVGLVVARLLYQAFPDEREGALARRHAVLVQRDSLAAVARDIGLAEHLRLSRGEEEAGGRHNLGLLADACEAVIAALYLDGGLRTAERFIRRHWRPLIAADVRPPTDAKTALQEWAQARGLALPVYRETAREGPAHAPVFSVEVEVPGLAPASATGRSKQIAEKTAAERLLRRIEKGE